MLLSLLAACQDEQPAPKAESTPTLEINEESTAQPIAIVNQRKIGRETFDIYKQLLQGQPDARDLSDQEILDRLIDQELWLNEARNKNLYGDRANQIRSKLLNQQFYAEQAQKFLTKTKLITTEQIKEEFNQRFTPENLLEVQLYFIRQTERAKIDNILGSLKLGADFKSLANYHPQASASTELPPWISINRLPSEQTDAVRLLTKGQYTPEPLHYDDDWLLIYLADTRTAPKPTLKDVKQQIIADLQQQQIERRLRVLRQEAEIAVHWSTSPKQTEPQDGPEPPPLPLEKLPDATQEEPTPTTSPQDITRAQPVSNVQSKFNNLVIVKSTHELS